MVILTVVCLVEIFDEVTQNYRGTGDGHSRQYNMIRDWGSRTSDARRHAYNKNMSKRWT